MPLNVNALFCLVTLFDSLVCLFPYVWLIFQYLSKSLLKAALYSVDQDYNRLFILEKISAFGSSFIYYDTVYRGSLYNYLYILGMRGFHPVGRFVFLSFSTNLALSFSCLLILTFFDNVYAHLDCIKIDTHLRTKLIYYVVATCPTGPSLVRPPLRLRLRIKEFQSNRSPVRFVPFTTRSESQSLASASTSSHSTPSSSNLAVVILGRLPIGIRDQSCSAIKRKRK